MNSHPSRDVDVCIIGGGISGLYCAYLYKKQNPGCTLVVLEKSGYIGGRVRTKNFQGTKVVQGAGVGRFPKDITLLKLAKELDVPIHVYPMKVHYDYNVKRIQESFNMEDVLKTLRSGLKRLKEPITFREYAEKELGKNLYQKFVSVVGYTDFENTDAYYAVHYYGFDDVYNHTNNQKFSLDWDLLLSRLIDAIGRENILINAEVMKLYPKTNTVIYKVKHTSFSRRMIYTGESSGRSPSRESVVRLTADHKVVIAAPTPTIRHLLPSAEIFKYIQGQPFLYVYAKLTPDSDLAKYIPSYSVVHTSLQKIIPFDANNNVFMIGYVDNENAKQLKKIASKNYSNELTQMIKKSFPRSKVHVESIWSKYWKVGTHYIKPFYPKFSVPNIMRKLHHPYPNVMVVGEAVSYHQGWVQGALDSVEQAMNHKSKP